MQSAMVTGRMSQKKKDAGNKILHDHGMTASEAINILYSKIIEDRSVAMLEDVVEQDPVRWKAAAAFIDSLPAKHESRFDSMSDPEIKVDRLHAKGLI